jgi:hypothetical protein
LSPVTAVDCTEKIPRLRTVDARYNANKLARSGNYLYTEDWI